MAVADPAVRAVVATDRPRARDRGLGLVLTLTAGSHVDHAAELVVNNFLNWYTLIQTATDASFFAIMAVGATIVIISGGIDLSVGSI